MLEEIKKMKSKETNKKIVDFVETVLYMYKRDMWVLRKYV